MRVYILYQVNCGFNLEYISEDKLVTSSSYIIKCSSCDVDLNYTEAILLDKLCFLAASAIQKSWSSWRRNTGHEPRGFIPVRWSLKLKRLTKGPLLVYWTSIPWLQPAVHIDGCTLHLETNSIRGTGMYLKTNLTYESLPTSTIFAEHTLTAIKIPLLNHDSITTRICCIYRSPNSSDTNNYNLHQLFTELNSNNRSHSNFWRL